MPRKFSEILRRLVTTQVAWPVLLTLGLLCTASLLAIGVAAPKQVWPQERAMLIGLGAMLVVLIPHYQHLGRFSYPVLGGILVLLGLVLLTDPIKGSKRWFALPLDQQLQPSELAKIAYVLAMAWYLRFPKKIKTMGGLVGPILITLLPMGLIVVEPDLGTALLFPIALVAMLITAGARLRHLLAMGLMVLVLLPGLYPFLQPYQKKRITSIVSVMVTSKPPRHMEGALYQRQHSMVALGSGGMWGQGAEASDHIRQGILPEAHTDFIFSVIGAQWGFLGCGLVIGLYLAFLGASLEIAGSARDAFGRLVVTGLVTLILGQAFINIAMTTGLGPVVGIALPFISYGGSSLVTMMIATGIILNVSLRRGT